MRLIDADSFMQHLHEPMKYGYSLIDHVKNEPTVPTFGRWISVKDRLPELDARYASDEVIIYVKDYDSGCPTIGYYIIDTWYSPAMIPIESRYSKVTHWMPMPEPPEVE